MNLRRNETGFPPRGADGPPGGGGRAAFTMIEIALCLAVIGFALVAIIGVLPAGLSVQKDNREETIINYEANFLMDAIRSGSQGQDDLTNYVMIITNQIYTYQVAGTRTNLLGTAVHWYTPTNYFDGTATHSVPFLTNGANIIGLMSMPKYIQVNQNTFSSNIVTADFIGISGPAADQGADPASRDFAFRYRVEVELIGYGDNLTGYDPSWVNPTASGLSTQEQAWRAANQAFYAYVKPNFYLVRLRFKWPVFENGRTGVGRQVFRSAVGGSLNPQQLFAGRATAQGFFMKPGNYVYQPATP